MKLISILTVSILLSISSFSSAAYYATPYRTPISIQQPAGQWVLYGRPTWIGQALFGPMWVFIPAAPGPNQPQPQNQAPLQNPAFINPLPR